MLSPTELYPAVLGFLNALEWIPHLSARAAMANLLTSLLVAQSLHPADLMRTTLSPLSVPARQRYRRVARVWTRPWLSPSLLTAVLVRAVLILVRVAPPARAADGGWVVVLDSVRCGPWEIFTVSVAWHGRALPVSWAVLPYPWPKGRFTPSVCALLCQLERVWPPDEPLHLLADRGFPSRQLFATLRQLHWGWTVRLRAKSYVTAAGRACWAKELLSESAKSTWRSWSCCYETNPTAPPGTLIIGQGLPVLPWHQRTRGSLRHRAAQKAARTRHLQSKHPHRPPDDSVDTDAWVILFSSCDQVRAVAQGYRWRWTTEGTYRDAQGGWDGRHGWDLEAVVARQTKAWIVERLVGLWAMGTLVQCWVGAQTLRADAPALLQAHLRQWATTPRLSLWARGQCVLTDPRGLLHDWLGQTLTQAATRLRTADTLSRPAPTRPLQEAA
jgi:hypothetical protein